MARTEARSPASAAQVVVERIDEIVLDGAKVQVRGQDLALDSIQLDPTNPRVANTVAVGNSGSGEAMQQGLRDILWSNFGRPRSLPFGAREPGPHRTDHRAEQPCRSRRQLPDRRLPEAGADWRRRSQNHYRPYG